MPKTSKVKKKVSKPKAKTISKSKAKSLNLLKKESLFCTIENDKVSI